MSPRCVVLVLGCFACRITGHGILTSPEPREGTAVGDGKKLTGSARDANCGGADNGDPGFDATNNRPKVAYLPGQGVVVQWKLTIPHPDDDLNIGVRIALHYADDNSFNSNILLGCLSGDSGCDDKNAQGQYTNRVSAGGLGNQGSELVTLPEGKTCSYCVLQWVWEAKADGGHYAQCVDIAITEDGFLPDFAALPNVESDTNNNGLPDGVAGGGSNPNDSGGSSSVGVGVGVVVALLLIGGLGFLAYKYRGSCPLPGKGSSQGAAGLPPGWTSAIDPASNRPYYTNSATGETTWEMPKSGGVALQAAQPSQAPAQPLPPGWQSAVDPATSKPYFVNTITGQTTWEHPSEGRF